MIATDKILSLDEFKITSYASRELAYLQLAALCREYHKRLEDVLCIPSASKILGATELVISEDSARELLAAFPETLREKSAPDDGSDEEYSEEEDYLTGR